MTDQHPEPADEVTEDVEATGDDEGAAALDDTGNADEQAGEDVDDDELDDDEAEDTEQAGGDADA